MSIETWNSHLKPLINGHIHHPHFDQAYSELMGALNIHRPGDIIVLTGVSGSGKTTMIDMLFKNKMFERSQTIVPAIRSIVLNSDHKNQHDPKWLAKSLLADIDSPAFWVRPVHPEDSRVIDALPRKSTTQLYIMLASEIRAKQTMFVFIDEASHLGFSPKVSENPVPTMSRLKTFAEENKICLILSGTHETLDMLSKTTHLHRRSNFIFLKHYNIHEEEDRFNFNNLIKEIETYIPGMKEINTNGKLTRLIMKGSLGSPGFALNWITTACVDCASRGLEHLTLESIFRKAPSEKDVELRKQEAELAARYYPETLESAMEKWNWSYQSPKDIEPTHQPSSPKKSQKKRAFVKKAARKVNALTEPGKRGNP